MDPHHPKNLQIVPFFAKLASDDNDDNDVITPPSSINAPTTPTSVVEPESGLEGEGPQISRNQMVGSGGGGAFSQSICAVKSCQQVVFKLPSRPGYVMGLSAGSSGRGCRCENQFTETVKSNQYSAVLINTFDLKLKFQKRLDWIGLKINSRFKSQEYILE